MINNSTLLAVVDHPEIREEVASKNEQLAGFLKGMVVSPEKMGQVRNMFEVTVRVTFSVVQHAFVEEVLMHCSECQREWPEYVYV